MSFSKKRLLVCRRFFILSEKRVGERKGGYRYN
nr:MAG TPA: hypothetical protein [Caudoviricetes sp.]